MGLVAPGPQTRSSVWWSETLAEDDREFERQLSPASCQPPLSSWGQVPDLLGFPQVRALRARERAVPGIRVCR